MTSAVQRLTDGPSAVGINLFEEDRACTPPSPLRYRPVALSPDVRQVTAAQNRSRMAATMIVTTYNPEVTLALHALKRFVGAAHRFVKIHRPKRLCLFWKALIARKKSNLRNAGHKASQKYNSL